VISVLDSGDYGSITITKSLTVRAEGVDGGATDAPGFGIFIVVQAGATDVVTVEVQPGAQLQFLTYSPRIIHSVAMNPPSVLVVRDVVVVCSVVVVRSVRLSWPER